MKDVSGRARSILLKGQTAWFSKLQLTDAERISRSSVQDFFGIVFSRFFSHLCVSARRIMFLLQTGKTYADCSQNGALISNRVPSLRRVAASGNVFILRCRPVLLRIWAQENWISCLQSKYRKPLQSAHSADATMTCKVPASSSALPGHPSESSILP